MHIVCIVCSITQLRCSRLTADYEYAFLSDVLSSGTARMRGLSGSFTDGGYY